MAWGDGAGPNGGDNGGNADAGNDAAGAASSGANVGGYADGSTSSGLSQSSVVAGLRATLGAFGLGPMGAAIGLGSAMGAQPGATAANPGGGNTGANSRIIGSGSNPIDTGSVNYQQWAPYVQYAANQNGVDPSIMTSLLWSESSLNPTADNGQGYRGIAQFDPATAARYGVTLGDPISEINGASAYLGDLVKKYGGNYQTAIANYKGSPTSPVALAQAQGVLNNAQALTDQSGGTSITPTYTTQQQSTPAGDTTPFWQLSPSGLASDIKKGFVGFFIGVIGVVLIVGVAYKMIAGKEILMEK